MSALLVMEEAWQCMTEMFGHDPSYIDTLDAIASSHGDMLPREEEEDQDRLWDSNDDEGDNIFVDTSTGDIKIGDFGLATRLDKSDTCSVLGTPEYMAIELFNSTPDNKYTSKVDVYAFGCLLLQMVTGKSPHFECESVAQVAELGSKLEALKAEKTQLEQELSGHQSDRATAKQDAEKAQSLRTKENGEFTAAENDMSTNIKAMKGAISALSKGMGSFMRVSASHASGSSAREHGGACHDARVPASSPKKSIA